MLGVGNCIREKEKVVGKGRKVYQYTPVEKRRFGKICLVPWSI